MILALRLGRTLGELMDAIDTHELSLWRSSTASRRWATSAPTCWPPALPPWWRRRRALGVRVTDMLVRWDADDAQPSAEAGADALKAFLLSKVNKGS